MKKIDKNKLWIEKELETWKKETDKYKDIKDLPIKKYKANFKKLSELHKWQEDLYFIKEGKETIVSGGALLWLFLYCEKKESYKPSDEIIKNYPNNVLEEFKIAHRLKLFNLKLTDFDSKKVREMLE